MQPSKLSLRAVLLLGVTLLGGVLVFGAAYLLGGLGARVEQRPVVYDALSTNPPPQPGTPIARFEQVNPAVVEYIDRFQSGYRPAVSDAFGVDVQPLGAYLPRSGNRNFALQAPTPLPTPFPYPTSPPLPAPAVPNAPRPTVDPSDGRTVPFDEDATECAPEGRPVDGILTQRYHHYHQGIDIGVPVGTPVTATHSGQVIYADWNNIGYGYLVILQSGAFITYYAHNTSFNVAAGQYVGKGSILAWSGSTGNSTGPHVHYETRVNDIPVDPLTFENRGYGTC